MFLLVYDASLKKVSVTLAQFIITKYKIRSKL